MSPHLRLHTLSPTPLSNLADAVAEQLPSAVIAIDVEARLVLANRRARELLGISDRRVTLRPKHWCERCDFRRPRETHLLGLQDLPSESALRGEDVPAVRLEVRNHGRPWRTVDVDASALRDERGAIAGAVLVMSDVTDQAVAEDHMRLPAAVTENTADALGLVRAEDGELIYVNRGWERMFGYRSSELVGRHVSVVTAPTDEVPGDRAQRLREAIERDHLWQGDIKNLRKDGTMFWSSVTASMFDHPDQGRLIVVAHSDCTNQRTHVEALQEAERRLRAVVDGALVGIVVLDADLRIRSVNPFLCRLIDRGEADLVGMQLADMVHPDDLGPAIDAARRASTAAAGHERLRSRLLTRHGKPRWVTITYGAIAPTGGMTRYQVAVIDTVEGPGTEGA